MSYNWNFTRCASLITARNETYGMRYLTLCGAALLLGLELPAQENSTQEQNGPAVPVAAKSTTAAPLTVGKRFEIYLKDTYDPLTFVGAAFSGGIDQLRNEPHEWEQGGRGYARRFGSWFGQVGIKDTIQFGVAALDGEDPRYHPSKRKGMWARSCYAVGQTFFPYKAKGGRMLAYSMVTGALSSGLIANAWYPDSRNSWGDGLARGGALVSGDIGNNLFQEFWPDIKAKVFRRKKGP